MKLEGLNDILASFFESHPKENIGSDLVFINNVRSLPLLDYPIKPGIIMGVFCYNGYIKSSVNMKYWKFAENSLHIILPDQTFQYHAISNDFSGVVFLSSIQFLSSFELNVKDLSNAFLHLRESPVMSINPVKQTFLRDFFSLLHGIARMHDNSYQLEMAKLLLQTFFYATTNFQYYRDYRDKANSSISRVDNYFGMFHDLLIKHYKESRKITFYANKLCLNPKYLATIIKEKTGKPASKWINDFVISEAKLMFNSTKMTIQEIGISLGFPNQSFFGKYFKHHTGLSPKEYRARL